MMCKKCNDTGKQHHLLVNPAITLIPLPLLDASDRQVRSASLSSDDVVGHSHQSLSRSSTLPYDHAPQRAQPQHGPGGVRNKTRPASPGSEMVTLEEFLQESNKKSPPVVRNLWRYWLPVVTNVDLVYPRKHSYRLS